MSGPPPGSWLGRRNGSTGCRLVLQVLDRRLGEPFAEQVDEESGP